MQKLRNANKSMQKLVHVKEARKLRNANKEARKIRNAKRNTKRQEIKTAGRVGPRLLSCNRHAQTVSRQQSIMCKPTAPH